MSNPNNPINKIIGTGLASPIRFNKDNSNQLFLMAEGLDVINSSIRSIMETRKGERWNNPEYGCDITRRIFEPNDFILKNTLRFDVTDALERWEKRITLQDVSVLNYENDSRLEEHLILIIVNYIVKSTRTPGSYVYPFVLNAMPTNELFNKGI